VGIELVKIILFTIPYLLASSDNFTLQQKASEILEKTDIVASAAHALEALVDPYPSREGEEKPMAFGSLIGLLQRQLQAEAASGWKLSCIPRVYELRSKPVDAENGEANGNADAAAATQHTFPTINVPSPVNAGPKPLFPEIFFSLYADQEIESVPPTSTVAACLVRDGLTDTINILDFNRNAAAKILTQMDNFWAPGVFARRETAFDKLRDFSSDVSTWKPEDISVDAIFSQIFRLPASEHRLVYYHSLITELCKISPAAVAPSLGRAIRFLFRSLESMDMELSYRFMDWFAHHLSNFEFRWKWNEWYVTAWYHGTFVVSCHANRSTGFLRLTFPIFTQRRLSSTAYSTRRSGCHSRNVSARPSLSLSAPSSLQVRRRTCPTSSTPMTRHPLQLRDVRFWHYLRRRHPKKRFRNFWTKFKSRPRTMASKILLCPALTST
jgi:hypothetical protein